VYLPVESTLHKESRSLPPNKPADDDRVVLERLLARQGAFKLSGWVFSLCTPQELREICTHYFGVEPGAMPAPHIACLNGISGCRVGKCLRGRALGVDCWVNAGHLRAASIAQKS
jgi:hypothetical protein